MSNAFIISKFNHGQNMLRLLREYVSAFHQCKLLPLDQVVAGYHSLVLFWNDVFSSSVIGWSRSILDQQLYEKFGYAFLNNEKTGMLWECIIPCPSKPLSICNICGDEMEFVC